MSLLLPPQVIIHNCVMHPDMKKMLHKPTIYSCSAAFDQHAHNNDIYANVAAPMLENVLKGGIGTIMMYGQTGSGKTYTMSSIEETLSLELFSSLSSGNPGLNTDGYSENYEVTVKFIELAGKRAVDLLQKKRGQEVKIVDEMQGMGNAPPLGTALRIAMRESIDQTDVLEKIKSNFAGFAVVEVKVENIFSVLVKFEDVHGALEALRSAALRGMYDMEQCLDPDDESAAATGEDLNPRVCVKWRNAAELQVNSPEELSKCINFGKSRRATEATDVNGTSSRSHAVLQITVNRQASKKSRAKRGILTLIDCAGSERRNDSLYHDKERQKESAEINASLYALKKCIRARCELEEKPNTFIPYRSSLLTRVLRESFEVDRALLSIIATAAPNATDTEHTMETLRSVSVIVGAEKDIVALPEEQVLMAHELQERIHAAEGGSRERKPKNQR